MNYATKSSVSSTVSEGEIKTMILRAGGRNVFTGQGDAEAIITFELHGRRIMFQLPLPELELFNMKTVRGKRVATSSDQKHRLWEQACRSKWRGLVLTVKAKLVSVEMGVELFEEAFLAQIVVPGRDGGKAERFGKVAIAAIAQAYTGGKLPPLLGSGS